MHKQSPNNSVNLLILETNLTVLKHYRENLKQIKEDVVKTEADVRKKKQNLTCSLSDQVIENIQNAISNIKTFEEAEKWRKLTSKIILCVQK